MKKYLTIALVLLTTTAAFAQNRRTRNPPPTAVQDTTSALTKALKNATPPPPPPKKVDPNKKDWSKVVVDKRKAADHFLFELGYDNWANIPDSIHIKGFNHSESVYFMYNFPFKSDVRFSVAAGIGISSSNIYFNQQEVLVAAYQATSLGFPDETGGNHFKRYKLTTSYLEIPIELRFTEDPTDFDHSWKFAVGAKVGLMMSAYTKGVDLVSASNQIIGNYTEKESSKQFFNIPRLAGTLRVSKGVFGIFGQIAVNSLIKAANGPAVFPFSMGVTLSGL